MSIRTFSYAQRFFALNLGIWNYETSAKRLLKIGCWLRPSARHSLACDFAPVVRSRLLYSCQTWSMTMHQRQRIRSSYMSMLRKMVKNEYLMVSPLTLPGPNRHPRLGSVRRNHDRCGCRPGTRPGPPQPPRTAPGARCAPARTTRNFSDSRFSIFVLTALSTQRKRIRIRRILLRCYCY